MKNVYYEILHDNDLHTRKKAIVEEINESLANAFDIRHANMEQVLKLIDKYNRSIRELDNVPF